ELLQRLESAQGAEKLGLLGPGERHPKMSVAVALADLVTQVVEVDRRRLAADGGELRQRVAEHRHAAHRQQRLGRVKGERTQPRTQTGCQYQRADPPCLHALPEDEEA